MLDAAHRRFLKESYENVGLREIAGDVGVDVALVSRYFGSKEELFREVLGVDRKEEILPADVTPAEVPAYLARMFVQQGNDGNEHAERLLIMLRSASSPTASAIVREALRKDVLRPLAEKLGGDRPEVRASTSMAVWMGMTILRTVMTVEPLCGGSDDVEDRIRLLFEAALAENPRS
jgi:AcrR family transcriptional regulator